MSVTVSKNERCECYLMSIQTSSSARGVLAIVRPRLWNPFDFFFLSYITCFFFLKPLSLHTRTTTIQPVHSGGCHGNWAASMAFFCPVSPLHLSFPRVQILHANWKSHTNWVWRERMWSSGRPTVDGAFSHKISPTTARNKRAPWIESWYTKNTDIM